MSAGPKHAFVRAVDAFRLDRECVLRLRLLSRNLLTIELKYSSQKIMDGLLNWSGTLLNSVHDDILIPTDGSEEVEPTLEHGFNLAMRYDATIHALYVVDDTTGGTGVVDLDDRNLLEGLYQQGEEAVEIVEKRGHEDDIDVTTDVRTNRPHEGILGYADDHDVDVLVMSSQGRSGVSRFLFGSVTERVLRLTNRPVLVVTRSERVPETTEL